MFWLVASLALLLTGCASVRKHSLTCHLWAEKDLRTFSQPAPQPSLALYETANHTEVLVQYDALSEGQSSVRRKAYFVPPDQAGSVTEQKPKFVKLSVAEDLKPIPIFAAEPEATNAPARPIPHAVTAPDSRSFTLHQDNGRERSIGLPVYAEDSSLVIRVAATPVAVVADAFVLTVYLCFDMYLNTKVPVPSY